MRVLSTAFAAEQKKALRRPLVKLEVASYGHPAAVDASALQWSDYFWELLVSDSTTVNKHAVAMPADGSICRVRVDGVHIKYQRVTSPSSSSDWTSWADWGDGPANNPIGLAASGTEVIAFGNDGVNLYYKKSTNSGSTFGSWTVMSNARPCERGCAAAFKANGDIAVVHASDFNDPTSLYIQRRTSGTWSTGLGQISGDFELSALALYHKDDWNILALILDGGVIRLARGIYGDGGSYSAGTWSGWEFINSYKAAVSFTGQTRLRLWKTQGRGKSEPTYYERFSAVSEKQATDTLGVDDPYITYHSSLGAVFSFSKSNKPWFYRLRQGTAFADSDWNKAWPLDVSATYGLALCCDGTYLYAAAPNQVWRTALPGSWAPPSAGAGAGTNYAIPAAHVLGVREEVAALAPGKLSVILDNSRGTYNSLGGGASSAVGKLKLGAQVTLSIGYRTDTDLLSVAGKYYVEGIGYSRTPGQSHLNITAVDAWFLLSRYIFNRPMFWNESSDVTTAYSIVEKLVQAVGGSLSYVSRSSDITGTYPRIEVHTGENAAVVLRQLLSLFPDVIFFVGLNGYIVYPQAADASTYELRFRT